MAVNLQTIKEYIAAAKLEQPFKADTINMRGNPASKKFIKAFATKHSFANEGHVLDFIIKTFDALFVKGADALKSLTDKYDKVLLAKEALEQKVAERDEQLKAALDKITELQESSLTDEEQKELKELREEKERTMQQMEKFLNALLEKYPHLNNGKERSLMITDDYLQLADDLVKPYQDAAEKNHKTVAAISQDPEYRKLKEGLELELPKLVAVLHPEVAKLDRVPVSEELFVEMMVNFCNVDKSASFPTKEYALKAIQPYIKK